MPPLTNGPHVGDPPTVLQSDDVVELNRALAQRDARIRDLEAVIEADRTRIIDGVNALDNPRRLGRVESLRDSIVCRARAKPILPAVGVRRPARQRHRARQGDWRAARLCGGLQARCGRVAEGDRREERC